MPYTSKAGPGPTPTERELWTPRFVFLYDKKVAIQELINIGVLPKDYKRA